MIARQVAMRSVRKSDFGELVRYITDTQGSTERVGAVVVTNCTSDKPADAAVEVRLTQQENTRSRADKSAQDPQIRPSRLELQRAKAPKARDRFAFPFASNLTRQLDNAPPSEKPLYADSIQQSYGETSHSHRLFRTQAMKPTRTLRIAITLLIVASLAACGPSAKQKREAAAAQQLAAETAKEAAAQQQLAAETAKAAFTAAAEARTVARAEAEKVARETAKINGVKDLIREQLKDPNSAQFRNLRVKLDREGKDHVCGEVNARNGFGGYVGFRPFFVTREGNDGRRQAFLSNGAEAASANDVVATMLLQQMCKD